MQSIERTALRTVYDSQLSYCLDRKALVRFRTCTGTCACLEIYIFRSAPWVNDPYRSESGRLQDRAILACLSFPQAPSNGAQKPYHVLVIDEGLALFSGSCYPQEELFLAYSSCIRSKTPCASLPSGMSTSRGNPFKWQLLT